jgi:hypothetical protein
MLGAFLTKKSPNLQLVGILLPFVTLQGRFWGVGISSRIKKKATGSHSWDAKSLFSRSFDGYELGQQQTKQ